MPSRDRLADLQLKQGKKPGKSENNDVEVRIALLPHSSSATKSTKNSAKMDRFFEQVDVVSDRIELWEMKVELVKSLHNVILDKPTSATEEKQDLVRTMQVISGIAAEARKGLLVIEQDVQSAEGTGKQKTPVDYRIKKTQHVALARRLMGVMTSYNQEQVDYRRRCRERMKRQLQIADSAHSRTDQQVEEMLDSPNSLVFSQGIIADSQRAKEALADVEVRHQEMLALEKNIAELKGLFDELGILIENQGEMVDRIEDNVEQAVIKTDSANKETASALTKQKKARKMKLACGILLIVLVLIIVAALLWQFT